MIAKYLESFQSFSNSHEFQKLSDPGKSLKTFNDAKSFSIFSLNFVSALKINSRSLLFRANMKNTRAVSTFFSQEFFNRLKEMKKNS